MNGGDGCRETAAGRGWSEVIRCIEAELCEFLDLHEGAWPDNMWCGRKQWSSVVQRPAMPPRVEGKLGSASQEETGNVLALNRLEELS